MRATRIANRVSTDHQPKGRLAPHETALRATPVAVDELRPVMAVAHRCAFSSQPRRRDSIGGSSGDPLPPWWSSGNPLSSSRCIIHIGAIISRQGSCGLAGLLFWAPIWGAMSLCRWVRIPPREKKASHVPERRRRNNNTTCDMCNVASNVHRLLR